MAIKNKKRKIILESKHRSILFEHPAAIAALKIAAGIAAEESAFGAITVDKLLDKTESQEAMLFLMKYQSEINSGIKFFYKKVKSLVENQSDIFFLPSESKKIVGIFTEEDNIREYHKKIINKKYSIERFLFEDSIRYAKGGLSDMNKLVTSQVDFVDKNGNPWKYKIPNPDEPNFEKKLGISSANYFIADGRDSLGDIQFRGDPFTYEDSGDGKLKVVSAPDFINSKTGKSYKDSIGSEFSIPKPKSSRGGPRSKKVSPAPEETVITTITLDLSEEEEEIISGVDKDLSQSIKDKVIDQINQGIIPFLGVVSIEYGNNKFPFSPNSKSNIAQFCEDIKNHLKPRFECDNRYAMSTILVGEVISSLFTQSAKQFETGMSDPTIAADLSLAGDPKYRLKVARKISEIGTKIRRKINSDLRNQAMAPPFDDIEVEDMLALGISIVNWFKNTSNTKDRCGKSISGVEPAGLTPEDIAAITQSAEAALDSGHYDDAIKHAQRGKDPNRYGTDCEPGDFNCEMSSLPDKGCFIPTTKISMWDGTFKEIKDISVGNEVISMSQDQMPTKGIVTHVLVYPTSSTVKAAKLGNLICNPTHPIYYNGEWSEIAESAAPVEIVEEYVETYFSLEIDAHDIYGSEHNFIADGYIMSGLGDHVELNTVYQRQNKWKDDNREVFLRKRLADCPLQSSEDNRV